MRRITMHEKVNKNVEDLLTESLTYAPYIMGRV
jgi:hypothetical protein